MEPKVYDYVMEDGTKIQCLFSQSEEPHAFDACRHMISFTMYVDSILWMKADAHWGLQIDDPELGEWIYLPIVACVMTHAMKLATKEMFEAMGVSVPGAFAEPHIDELTDEQCNTFMDDHGADVFLYLSKLGHDDAVRLGILDRLPTIR